MIRWEGKGFAFLFPAHFFLLLLPGMRNHVYEVKKSFWKASPYFAVLPNAWVSFLWRERVRERERERELFYTAYEASLFAEIRNEYVYAPRFICQMLLCIIHPMKIASEAHFPKMEKWRRKKEHKKSYGKGEKRAQRKCNISLHSMSSYSPQSYRGLEWFLGR